MAQNGSRRNMKLVGALLGTAVATVVLLTAGRTLYRHDPQPDKPVELEPTRAKDVPTTQPQPAQTGPTAFDQPGANPENSQASREAGGPADEKPSPFSPVRGTSQQGKRHGPDEGASVAGMDRRQSTGTPSGIGRPTLRESVATDVTTVPNQMTPPQPVALKYSLIVQKEGGLIANGATETLSKTLNLSATVHAQGPVPPNARIRIDWSTASHGGVSPIVFGPEGLGKVFEYNNKLWPDDYTVQLSVDGEVLEAVKLTVK